MANSPPDSSAPADHAAHAERPHVSPDAVERAAMPFHGVRTSDSTPLPPEALLDQLSEADIICIGEDHDNPHDHYAQLRILRGLIERRKMNGRELGVGLEMVASPEQETLDSWQAGELSTDELATELDWDASWGWDFNFYRPQLELARASGVPVIALNVPRKLARAAARGQLDSLSEDDAKLVPELDLTDAKHRAWFKSQMHHHPSPHAAPDDLYAAQVLWDEGMAASADRFLSERVPGRQLAILAGAGHCWRRAIPARLERRTTATAVSVRPVLLPSADHPLPDTPGYDFLFVMHPDE